MILKWLNAPAFRKPKRTEAKPPKKRSKTELKHAKSEFIGVDPHVRGGKPHVLGTLRTVEEIQAFWNQPGVHVHHIREAFPELTENQLGAAVTWREYVPPNESYVAESPGPPRRRLYLHSAGKTAWLFAYSNFDEDGDEVVGGDHFADNFADILHYTEDYPGLIWRNEYTGEVVDIYALERSP